MGLIEAGLSPRVRGNPQSDADTAQTDRSIPACGGGTTRQGKPIMSFCGLSPRVRGNRSVLGDADGLDGSIPACAGEPLCTTGSLYAIPVYPRVCGGTSSCVNPCLSSAGLSPRVRGNQASMVAVLPVMGSIPACAGEPT